MITPGEHNYTIPHVIAGDLFAISPTVFFPARGRLRVREFLLDERIALAAVDLMVAALSDDAQGLPESSIGPFLCRMFEITDHGT